MEVIFFNKLKFNKLKFQLFWQYNSFIEKMKKNVFGGSHK